MSSTECCHASNQIGDLVRRDQSVNKFPIGDGKFVSGVCEPDGPILDFKQRCQEIRISLISDIITLLQDDERIKVFKNDAGILTICDKTTEKVVLFDGIFVYHKFPVPFHIADIAQIVKIDNPQISPDICKSAIGMGILPDITLETHETGFMAKKIFDLIQNNLRL